MVPDIYSQKKQIHNDDKIQIWYNFDSRLFKKKNIVDFIGPYNIYSQKKQIRNTDKIQIWYNIDSELFKKTTLFISFYISSQKKARHDIIEILLKVALNTINKRNQSNLLFIITIHIK